MKTRITEEECGSPSFNTEKSPDQEILEEQGGIFSCGGVYLANCMEPPLKSKGPDFLFLPNHGKEVLVFKGTELQRRSGPREQLGEGSYQEKASPQDALRRFFKESLN